MCTANAKGIRKMVHCLRYSFSRHIRRKNLQVFRWILGCSRGRQNKQENTYPTPLHKEYRCLCVFFKFNRCAVSQKLRRSSHHLTGHKSNIDYSIRSLLLSIPLHALKCSIAGFRKHFRVLFDFASDYGAKSCHDVLPNVLRTNGVAPGNSYRFGNRVSGDEVGINCYHYFKDCTYLRSYRHLGWRMYAANST